MPTNTVSRALSKIIAVNNELRPYMKAFELQPNSNMIFGEDSYLLNPIGYMAFIMDKPYQPLDVTGVCGLTVDVESLYLMCKDYKKGEWVEFVIVNNQLGVKMSNGEEVFFAKMKTDYETYAYGSKFIEPSQMVDERSYVYITDNDIARMDKNFPIIIGEDDMAVKIAKPLLTSPKRKLKGSGIGYTTREIDDKEFRTYILKYKAGVSVLFNFRCFVLK